MNRARPREEGERSRARFAAAPAGRFRRLRSRLAVAPVGMSPRARVEGQGRLADIPPRFPTEWRQALFARRGAE